MYKVSFACFDNHQKRFISYMYPLRCRGFQSKNGLQPNSIIINVFVITKTWNSSESSYPLPLWEEFGKSHTGARNLLLFCNNSKEGHKNESKVNFTDLSAKQEKCLMT